jgi:perosamine synthetase
MNWKVPLAQPDLSGNEARYVAEAVESTWISSSGPFVERFETEFARLSGSRFALGVANGTVGLHLVLEALGVGPGDEVIVPSLTYIATANAVAYTGASPVFVDVDPVSWCLDVGAVQAAITARTVGIIAVHLYGHPADMDGLSGLAGRNALFLIEDAAEAHGARVRSHPVGGLGTAGVFSFYGNKIVTSGEGGAVTTSDAALDARLRLLRGQGMDPDRRYYFPVRGYNYRLTNVACALLCAQIERFDQMLSSRRTIDWLYRSLLGSLEGLTFQPRADWADPVPWLVSATVGEAAFGVTRDTLADSLADAGVETRPFFIPVHTLPPYQAIGAPVHLPVTERLAAHGLNLPTFSGMTEEQVRYVAGAVQATSR